MASPSSPFPSPSPITTASPPPASNPSPPNNDPPMATPLPLLMPPPSTVAVALAAPTPTPSTRRLPPPCWTPEETSSLIDAYRDKWYSLRRGNLRAAHWQDVADDVHRRCPHAVPPKTAVQCRHKMEKLRKRYRAELQRAKSIPHHRFSSSWVYFSKMDAMEKGPNANPAPPPPPPPPPQPVHTAVPLPENFHDLDDDDNGDDEDDDDEGSDGYPYPRRDLIHTHNHNQNGLRIKIHGNNPNSNSNSNSSSGSGFPSLKRNFAQYDENPNPNPNNPNNPNPSYGFSKQPKYGNLNSFSSPSPPQFDPGMRYGPGPGPRVVNNGINNNGSAGPSGLNHLNKKKKSGLGLSKSDRDRDDRGGDPAIEMVEAIRMLGEGFVRMEKMKMEMMRETERMRMEMEMKRTEMILDSQHRIVEAFVKGWTDSIKPNKDASS